MDIGDRVETNCEYDRVMHGKYVRGVIREISDKDKSVVKLEMPCGEMTWINKHWLRKRHCCCCCCAN